MRKGWSSNDRQPPLPGPVEVDQTFVGSKRKNIPKHRQEELTGRGAVGTTAVVGETDRATNQVPAKLGAFADKETLQVFALNLFIESPRQFSTPELYRPLVANQ